MCPYHIVFSPINKGLKLNYIKVHIPGNLGLNSKTYLNLYIDYLNLHIDSINLILK